MKKQLLQLRNYTRRISEAVLKSTTFFSPLIEDFMCEDHSLWGLSRTNRAIINIFFNNEQTIQNCALRKDAIKEFKARQSVKRRFKEI